MSTTDDVVERLTAQVKMLEDFIQEIAKQKPEKPDYWNSCSQCEDNISESEELLGKLK